MTQKPTHKIAYKFRIENPIKQCALKDLLDYSPETGIFTWRDEEHVHRAFRGKLAGCLHHGGYRIICVNGQIYQANRLAWIYMHGDMKNNYDVVRHKNGNLQDNRIENLELAPAVKLQYVNGQRRTSTAVKKAPTISNKDLMYRCSKIQVGRCDFKFMSSYMVDGKRVYVGSFETGREAYKAFIKSKHAYQQSLLNAESSSEGIAA